MARARRANSYPGKDQKMNTTPRIPIPAHDHFVRLTYPALLGGGNERRGPFRTIAEARRAIAAARAPYPGGMIGARVESVPRG